MGHDVRLKSLLSSANGAARQRGKQSHRFVAVLVACGLLGISAPLLAVSAPLVHKVEHILIVSNDPERLFDTFTQKYKLPVAWPFKDHGGFASGGVSMGNVVLEFLKPDPADEVIETAAYAGFALEPMAHTDSALEELDRRAIAHSAPDRSHEADGWVTFDLPQMPPARSNIFFCDYSQRPRAGRERAASELLASGGGPLGVIRVKDIVIGVPAVGRAARAWGRLTEDDAPVKRGVIRFDAGPEIHLVVSKTPRIERIEVVVNSLSQTRAFLHERHISSKEIPPFIAIDSKSTDGLTLWLTQE